MKSIGLKVMIIAFSMLALCILSGCGDQERVTHVDGDNCYAEAAVGGVNLVCGDVVTFLPDGVDGNDGVDGTNGDDGQDGTDGTNGSDGTNGVDGADGVDGQDGESCTAVITDDGILLTCPDSDPILIPVCDGDCDHDHDDDDDSDSDDKDKCNNGNGNGSEGCNASDNGNDDEDSDD